MKRNRILGHCSDCYSCASCSKDYRTKIHHGRWRHCLYSLCAYFYVRNKISVVFVLVISLKDIKIYKYKIIIYRDLLFSYPHPALVYTFAFLGGLGGSLLWIAQVRKNKICMTTIKILESGEI